MNSVPLVYEKLDPSLPDLEYQTDGAAGFDLCFSKIPDYGFGGSHVTLKPGERTFVHSGVRFDIPEGFEIQIRSRGSVGAKRGLTVAHGVGTVDCDYKGEVVIPILNTSTQNQQMVHGDRIAQAVLAPVTRAVLTPGVVEVDTERGEGGFGSTGR